MTLRQIAQAYDCPYKAIASAAKRLGFSTDRSVDFNKLDERRIIKSAAEIVATGAV